MCIIQITHWLDGSQVYGSSEADAKFHRGEKGKLKISGEENNSKGLLPTCPASKDEEAPEQDPCDNCEGLFSNAKREECFIGGDIRTNDGITLISFHTLFMREHNRLAEKLAELNPGWEDERLFQEARKINVAQYQHIVYKEWLPIILGRSAQHIDLNLFNPSSFIKASHYF